MDVIKKRISFCIELKDAFTNRSIEAEDIRVYVNGKPPFLQKERRYYIFQDVPTDTIKVDITSNFYEDRHCVLCLTEYTDQNLPISAQRGDIRNLFGIPFILILLYPGIGYPLPVGYKRIEYKGKPWEEIRVIKDRKSAFLLAADYCGGKTMHIVMSEKQEIEGICLRIESIKGEGYEDFSLTEQKDSFLYIMNKSLKGEYKKGSRIYELYCTKTDEKGRAVLIVKEDRDCCTGNNVL